MNLNSNFKNKQALGDIVSFLLILFLSIIATTGVYFYTNSTLNEQINELEFSKVEEQLIYTHNIFNYLLLNPTQSEPIIYSFSQGEMIINATTIRYISSIESSNNSSVAECITICYDNFKGFKSIFVNVSSYNNATLTSSQILTGDTYTMYVNYNEIGGQYGIFIE